jgi:hypothetical protein
VRAAAARRFAESGERDQLAALLELLGGEEVERRDDARTS